MFEVDGFTITMSRGDTGSVVVKATGHTFNAEDRAVFTVRSQDRTIVKEQAHQIDNDGCFTVSFLNADTDYLASGD